jgi:arabinofuranan 3-O-arabinosyltransferase
VYQTSVTGTVGELSRYLPLQAWLCAAGGTLSLGAGRHTLTAAAPGTFTVTDLSLTSGAVGALSGGSRAVTIRGWQPDQRQLGIGPGAASYLEVHENYNPGWTAALNGRELTPVRIDGWQQGFLVPAGAGGTITLIFRPAATYHLVLVLSLLAVAILLAVAAWSFTGRARRAAGLSADAGLTEPRGRAWLGVLGVTALVFVAGGPVALAVPVLAWLAGRPRPAGRIDPRIWLPWVAFGGMAASGLLSAARPFGGGPLGPFGGPAQACALVALAAALTPAVTIPVRRRPAARQTPADAVPATTPGEAHR